MRYYIMIGCGEQYDSNIRVAADFSKHILGQILKIDDSKWLVLKHTPTIRDSCVHILLILLNAL